ncbi:DUF3343 domain-containing protein [Crassaminicella profunda]|uniref:DUF3343 domain-containing protein n=1 Tax=Crassaminicella profunda TaxID=1286698 RepID=UPI001CA69077|nr:DUF3343 domain-containing protein [Crassaminicella profunda]QZY57031.1 DUF3343 domain-containing protein [Crassaminicella profunda]
MVYSHEKYLIVFSSNYHGYYIEQLFNRSEIKNTLRKAPRAIAKSCHSAIYIKEQDLDKALRLLRKSKISPQGVYEIIRIGSLFDYKKLQLK